MKSWLALVALCVATSAARVRRGSRGGRASRAAAASHARACAHPRGRTPPCPTILQPTQTAAATDKIDATVKYLNTSKAAFDTAKETSTRAKARAYPKIAGLALLFGKSDPRCPSQPAGRRRSLLQAVAVPSNCTTTSGCGCYCPPGYYFNGVALVPCPVNTYCPGGYFAFDDIQAVSTPQACPPGTFTCGATGSPTVNACDCTCQVNADCGGTTPICVSGNCAACMAAQVNALQGTCPATQFCVLGGSCQAVQCTSDAQCGGATPVCNGSGACAACSPGQLNAVQGTCPAGEFCRVDGTCKQMQCSTNAQCGGTTPTCTNGACVGCSPRQTPAVQGSCPAPEFCRADGSCNADQCTTNAECAGATPICAAGVCVPCTPQQTPAVQGSCPAPEFCRADGSCALAQCSTNAQCGGVAPVCSNGTCIACTPGQLNAVQGSCPATRFCLVDGSCAPAQCTTNAHCGGTTPVCNGSGACVACSPSRTSPGNNTCPVPEYCRPDGSCAATQCALDADCGGATPYCSANSTCVACTSFSQCSGATPVCDGTGTCVACTVAQVNAVQGTCPNSLYCVLGGFCQATQCTSAAQCGGTTPVCSGGACAGCAPARTSPGNNTCPVPSFCRTDGSCQQTQCATSADCGGTTPVCNGAGACVACVPLGTSPGFNTCPAPDYCRLDGSCQATQCTTSAQCAGTTPVCTAGACVACSPSSTLPGNNTCPATAYCRADGSCQSTQCTTSAQCSGTTPVCSGSGVCVACSPLGTSPGFNTCPAPDYCRLDGSCQATPCTVTSNTANLAQNAATLTIAGSGFNSATPSANSVVFDLGAAGTVTAATSTSLTVTFSTLPTSTGSLTAVVTSFGGSSGSAVQVATVVAPPAVTSSTANLAQNAATMTIIGTGFDTGGTNTVVFSGPAAAAAGTVVAVSPTELTVTFTTLPTNLGDLDAVVTSNGGSSGSAVKVATVVPAPVVTSSSANLAQNAPTLTIFGQNFDTVGTNTVSLLQNVFSAVAGTVVAVSSTELTVTFTTQPNQLGFLSAVVTSNGGRSSPPLQAVSVATVVAAPTIQQNGAGLAQNAPALTIAGTGFDTVGTNTVVFSGAAAPAAGTVVAVSSNQLTVTFTTLPTNLGYLDAVVTSFGGSSGLPVLVAYVV